MLQKHKDNISKGMTGLIRSQETKDKISGDKNNMWRGEEFLGANGRWWIWVDGIKYIRARYIAMVFLGRELKSEEEIHHINEICTDDRPENLYVFPTKGAHIIFHNLKNPPILTSNIIQINDTNKRTKKKILKWILGRFQRITM